MAIDPSQEPTSLGRVRFKGEQAKNKPEAGNSESTGAAGVPVKGAVSGVPLAGTSKGSTANLNKGGNSVSPAVTKMATPGIDTSEGSAGSPAYVMRPANKGAGNTLKGGRDAPAAVSRETMPGLSGMSPPGKPGSNTVYENTPGATPNAKPPKGNLKKGGNRVSGGVAKTTPIANPGGYKRKGK